MRTEEDILKAVEGSRAEIVKLLCDLISIPTENPPGTFYEECVNTIASLLKRWNIEHRVVAITNGHSARYAILGRVGDGRKTVLHFHGHYDVVPAQSAAQFKPLLKHDRVYGRGSADMKGGLVAMLYALRAMTDRCEGLDGKVSFSIVPDEESGGRLGTQYLAERGLLPPISLGMLMPEPTSGAIWNANKGALTYRVTIKGKSAHVGLACQGINSFEQMVSIVHSLQGLSAEIGKRVTHLPISPPEVARSQIVLGGVSGSGASYNVVPDVAFFTIDRRINPEEKLSDAKMEILDVLDFNRDRGIAVETELLQEGEPSSVSHQTPLARAIQRAAIDVIKREPAFQLCPGLCEIRYFNNRGIPAYAYGPGLLEVSHGPDEYVNMNNVLNCTKVYALLASRALSTPSSS